MIILDRNYLTETNALLIYIIFSDMCGESTLSHSKTYSLLLIVRIIIVLASHTYNVDILLKADLDSRKAQSGIPKNYVITKIDPIRAGFRE